MIKAKILIVEDENIVAKNIQKTLESLGYAVSAIASSGEKAIKKAEETTPNLVLMDIKLKGDIDGVEAAEQIRARFNIPVVYLTAYADPKTLQRAKVTEPYGYILKPFEERELHSVIEIALYKHKMERKLKESEQCLAAILKSVGDGVLVANKDGLVTFMNPVAEKLTGWKQKEALAKELTEVFTIIDEETRILTENPVAKVLQQGVVVGLTNHNILVARDGTETPIDASVAPVKDDKGEVTGVVLVIRDITERKQAERERRERIEELEKWHKLTVDRELRMIELKEKIRELETTAQKVDGMS